jgi:hypothetical protein
MCTLLLVSIGKELGVLPVALPLHIIDWDEP